MPPRKRKAPAPKPIATPIPEEEEESDEELEEVEVESSAEEEEEGSQSSSEEEEEEDDDEEDSSADESELQRETLLQLLGPFTKDQIIDLLKSAAGKDPKLLSKLIDKANSDPAHRKIFVHGLSWDATSEQLLEAFNQFGEIEESKLVTDKVTGRAKGYAFVQFKTRCSAKKALKLPQKNIGTRMVSCQLAAAGPPPGSSADAGDGGGSRKVYVGNVGPQVDAEKLKAFFSRYGEIEVGPIGLDFATNKFKGFAVFTYKSAEGFRKALEEPMKVFENYQLHCKKFVERPKNTNNLGSASSQITNAGAVSPAVIPGVANFGNMGMNPGMFGTNLNAGGIMMPQNFGFGFAGNSILAAAAGYNPAGLMGSGLSGGYGINSPNPDVMGSYGSQAALQGLGPFQNSSQFGQSGASTETRDLGRDQSLPRTFPSSYFSR